MRLERRVLEREGFMQYFEKQGNALIFRQDGETVDEVSELLVAPKCLQNKVLQMMDGQIANKKAGKEAYIGDRKSVV